jgi:hypothetical protein
MSYYSKLTDKTVQYLADLNLQPTNKFEFVILPRFPGTFGLGGSPRQIALNTLMTTIGNVIFKYHIQEIDIPFLEYDMGVAEKGIKFIKDVKYPDSISVKFIDGERGEALRAINGWMALIGTPDFLESGALGMGDNRYYKTENVTTPTPTGTVTTSVTKETDRSSKFGDDVNFAPDLQYMKQNCLIKIVGQKESGSSLLYPSILLRRAMPKKISNIKLSQESEEFLTFDVEFAVDQILISNTV